MPSRFFLYCPPIPSPFLLLLFCVFLSSLGFCIIEGALFCPG